MRNNLIMKRIKREAGFWSNLKNTISNGYKTIKDKVNSYIDKIDEDDNDKYEQDNEMFEEIKQSKGDGVYEIANEICDEVENMNENQFLTSGEEQLNNLLKELPYMRAMGEERQTKIKNRIKNIKDSFKQKEYIVNEHNGHLDVDENLYYSNHNVDAPFEKKPDTTVQDVYMDLRDMWHLSPNELDEWINDVNNIRRVRENLSLLKKCKDTSTMTQNMLKKLQDLYDLAGNVIERDVKNVVKNKNNKQTNKIIEKLKGNNSPLAQKTLEQLYEREQDTNPILNSPIDKELMNEVRLKWRNGNGTPATFKALGLNKLIEIYEQIKTIDNASRKEYIDEMKRNINAQQKEINKEKGLKNSNAGTLRFNTDTLLKVFDDYEQQIQQKAS